MRSHGRYYNAMTAASTLARNMANLRWSKTPIKGRREAAQHAAKVRWAKHHAKSRIK